MTFWGPTCSMFSSRVISCTSFIAGGGLYHNGYTSDWLNIVDTLFTQNTAETLWDGYEHRGGGALESFRNNSYDSYFSFSFFTGNVAKRTYGHDITIQTVKLSADCVSHSLTTAISNSFWNVDDHVLNWLPRGILLYTINCSADSSANTPHTNIEMVSNKVHF